MGVRLRHRQLTMLWLILVAARLGAVAAASEFERDHVVPGCNSTCGNVKIPYPFGIGYSSETDNTCFLNKHFNLTCNNSTLRSGNVPVLNISSEEGQLELSFFVSQVCYNPLGKDNSNDPHLRTPSFTISSAKNKFISVGCDTYGYLNTFQNDIEFSTGCLTRCNESPESMENLSNGNCSGIGCCQVDIPPGMKNITIKAYSFNNFMNTSDFNRCSYSFVAKVGSYNFSTKELPSETYPLVVDWAVGNETCEVAQNTSTYACMKSTNCEDTESRNGYRCKCKPGYDGNPYLNGCKDIDECKTLNPCTISSTCNNTAGNYSCSCPRGYRGDGYKHGSGCTPDNQSNRLLFVEIALGISVGLLVLLTLVSSICSVHKQRKLKQLREQFFAQNGGFLLQERLSQLQAYGEKTKIFTQAELEKATNNFHESRILGRGGQGVVYKGILPDNMPVAIKKSRIGADVRHVKDFINEVAVLSQINHRNVVKLLGCCLETEIPLLVYEFVSNGTLLDHIDPTKNESSIPWDTRLRIAVETAEAVSYLHSAASIPIIHRDIKSTNILLDHNHRAKVSDFGASRLIPLDQDQVTTLVQGTLGYLDPEYLHTGELNDKSDVYSFGVVLVELLTGKKAVEFNRPEQKNLAVNFVTSMREDRLMEILDRRVLNHNNVEQLKEVALLARRCIRVKGEKRPSMKEVAVELEGLIAMEKHPWVKGDVTSEENEYLLGHVADAYGSATTSTSAGYDSLQNHVAFEIEDGR